MIDKPVSAHVQRRRASKARRRASFVRACSASDDGSSEWVPFDDPAADAMLTLASFDRLYDPRGFEGD